MPTTTVMAADTITKDRLQARIALACGVPPSTVCDCCRGSGKDNRYHSDEYVACDVCRGTGAVAPYIDTGDCPDYVHSTPAAKDAIRRLITSKPDKTTFKFKLRELIANGKPGGADDVDELEVLLAPTGFIAMAIAKTIHCAKCGKTIWDCEQTACKGDV